MGTSNDYNSILIPNKQPVRQLSFIKYSNIGLKYKLFQNEFIDNCCNDDDDPYLYYILSGKMQIAFVRPDGSILGIAQRDAGSVFQAEYCGFASISGDKLKFIALENSILISFSKKQIFDLLKQDDELLEDYFYIVHLTYATLAHRLMNTAYLSSSQRFLTWLDKLCKTSSPNNQGHYVIDCDLTQQQIADLLFIHVTTCNKLIAGLEKEKIIKKTKKHIYVYDLTKLDQYLVNESKIIC